jgi:hypothetical protein
MLFRFRFWAAGLPRSCVEAELSCQLVPLTADEAVPQTGSLNASVANRTLFISTGDPTWPFLIRPVLFHEWTEALSFLIPASDVALHVYPCQLTFTIVEKDNGIPNAVHRCGIELLPGVAVDSVEDRGVTLHFSVLRGKIIHPALFTCPKQRRWSIQLEAVGVPGRRWFGADAAYLTVRLLPVNVHGRDLLLHVTDTSRDMLWDPIPIDSYDTANTSKGWHLDKNRTLRFALFHADGHHIDTYDVTLARLLKMGFEHPIGSNPLVFLKIVRPLIAATYWSLSALATVVNKSTGAFVEMQTAVVRLRQPTDGLIIEKCVSLCRSYHDAVGSYLTRVNWAFRSLERPIQLAFQPPDCPDNPPEESVEEVAVNRLRNCPEEDVVQLFKAAERSKKDERDERRIAEQRCVFTLLAVDESDRATLETFLDQWLEQTAKLPLFIVVQGDEWLLLKYGHWKHFGVMQEQGGTGSFVGEAPHPWSRLDEAIEEWALQYSVGKWKEWKLRSIYEPENGFMEGTFPLLMKILQIESVTIAPDSPLMVLMPDELKRAFEWGIETDPKIHKIIYHHEVPTPQRPVSQAIRKCDTRNNRALSVLLVNQGILKKLHAAPADA